MALFTLHRALSSAAGEGAIRWEPRFRNRGRGRLSRPSQRGISCLQVFVVTRPVTAGPGRDRRDLLRRGFRRPRPGADAADPAIFDVGAASANINPDTPQYIGGYGYKAGPFTTTHDDLEVRAFVVGKGDQGRRLRRRRPDRLVRRLQAPTSSPTASTRRANGSPTALERPGLQHRPQVGDHLLHPHPRRPHGRRHLGTARPAYLKKVADAAVKAATDAAADDEAVRDLDGSRQRPLLRLAERPGHQPPRRFRRRRRASDHVGP